jgi:hypothetical protein
VATAKSNSYPQLPFATHTWRISHHQGVLNPRLLQGLLFAASTYQNSYDPTQEINNYIVSNNLVPPNIRKDSKQADAWRDYQQLPSELGLIFSTRDRNRIQLTQAGLAYLDGGIGFTDLMTIQAFRWQYPNGHNTTKSAKASGGENFASQQIAAGILLKPAILVWHVLAGLEKQQAEASLSAAEIQHFLIPAKSNQDADLVVAAIIHARNSRARLGGSKERQRRHALEWMKRLNQTHAFGLRADHRLALSRFSIEQQDSLYQVMEELLRPESFWVESSQEQAGISWYLWYGSLDTRPYPLSGEVEHEDFGSDPEPEDLDKLDCKIISLRAYEWSSEVKPLASSENSTISSVYSAELSNSAHRLHDSMVRLIAERCERRKAAVFFDPDTVDLLIQHDGRELIIEVKSATSVNFVKKLRGALGQVLQYDYLRSRQVSTTRRKGIALTIDIAAAHWSKEFIADYMDMDLIGLQSGALAVHSNDPFTNDLLG